MIVWCSGKGKTREAGNDQRSRVVVRKMDRQRIGDFMAVQPFYLTL